MLKISVNKRDRFKRLAASRTNEVLIRLKVLGNCSNKSAYEYTEEEVNRIFAEIDRKTKEVRSKFSTNKHKKFVL